MAKTEQINVIIQDVQPIETLQSGARRQIVILMEPGFVNAFGEKVGRDNLFKVEIYGDRIEKYGLTANHIGAKAKARLAIASSERTINGGIRTYEVSARLNDINIIQ